VSDDVQPNLSDPSVEGGPIWITVLQAGVIGLVAGLALNALLSMVVLRGEGMTPRQASPKQCRKHAPARDAVAPPAKTPAASTMSGVRWVVVGVQARR
jgi:hypothetical protein